MKPWRLSALLTLLALAACGPIRLGTTESSAGAGGATGGTKPNGSGGTLPQGSSGAAPAGGDGVAGEAAESAAGGEGGASASPLACSGKSYFLEGRVTSERGAALAGVTLELTGTASDSATTDSAGYYRLELCAGDYELAPRLAGMAFCSKSVQVELTRDRREDFVGSSAGCETSGWKHDVLVLAFDPLIGAAQLSQHFGPTQPLELLGDFARLLERYSNGRLSYGTIEARPLDTFPPRLGGGRDTAVTFGACLDDPTACASAPVDFAALTMEQDLCEALDNGLVEEVWLLAPPGMGFEPSYSSACKRHVDVISFDYTRGLPSLFESYQRHVERALGQVTSLADDLNIYRNAAPELLGENRHGCGNADRAPNSDEPGVFDDPTVVESYCDGYFTPPITGFTPTPALSCQAWFCSELDYRRWWLQHLPTLAGVDSEQRLQNWWRYLAQPDDRSAPGPNRCSSSYQAGWCEELNDHVQGTCNVDEWAQATIEPGWVEYLWPEARTIKGLLLWDRACVAEQVQLGHIEFADGSDSIGFGALEPTGNEPTLVPFERTVTGFKVFIDISTGTHPGFGEIEVVE